MPSGVCDSCWHPGAFAEPDAAAAVIAGLPENERQAMRRLGSTPATRVSVWCPLRRTPRAVAQGLARPVARQSEPRRPNPRGDDRPGLAGVLLMRAGVIETLRNWEDQQPGGSK